MKFEGRTLVRRVAEQQWVPEPLRENIAGVLDLEDGWWCADPEEDLSHYPPEVLNFSEEVFTVLGSLLLFSYLGSCLPYAIVPGPSPSLNLKFVGRRTVEVHSASRLIFVESAPIRAVGLTLLDLLRELLGQLFDSLKDLIQLLSLTLSAPPSRALQY